MGHIWESFGSLGGTVLIVEGLGDMLESWRFLQGYPGRTQVETPHPGGGLMQ